MEDTCTKDKPSMKKKNPKAMKGKKLKNKTNLNNKKRKFFKSQLRKSEISDSEQHLLKKKKNVDSFEEALNPKQLHKEKKIAVSELNELRDILGVINDRDDKEKELEEFVFGHDSDSLEEFDDAASDVQSEKETEVQEEKEVRKPTWEDEDDENILVEEKASTLKNCHRSMSNRGSEKYSSFVQENFKKIVGEPKWAELGRKSRSDDGSDDELLQKTGNFILSSKALPKEFIRIQKCPNLVDESLKNSIVKCVEFHPSARVAVVAGTNGTANLFQIDGKVNAKIQSVYFENFPVHAAHFTLSGNEIFVGSNKYGHYFSYDMMSGKVQRICWKKGMEQKNIRRFQMSPDGKYFVIQGRYGYIHILTVIGKELIDSLKMNGEVIAITFNKDGSQMYSHGELHMRPPKGVTPPVGGPSQCSTSLSSSSDVGTLGDPSFFSVVFYNEIIFVIDETGEVYIWDMNTRKCIHKFFDEGCVIGTSLALSPNNQFLAAGSDSGVVNIYDTNTLLESNTPKPMKVLMNLTTEVTNMKFNCTSELLAMNSSHKKNALKLVHVPSMSVFSNFPVRENISSLNYINSLDISVNSGFLCVGNNLSTVHIFRLKHYNNY